MGKMHKVRQGDCLSSIAAEYGFFPDTIWQRPENAELADARNVASVLWHEEDTLFIPDRERREETAATDRRHRFRRKGIPEMLHFRIVDAEDRPRSEIPFRLTVDGETLEGTTDGGGAIRMPIQPNAHGGSLVLGGGEGEETYEFDLGTMAPIDYLEGVQARLNNLGYYHGPVDGEVDEELILGLAEFQEVHGLEVTGDLDDATLAKLEEVHGS